MDWPSKISSGKGVVIPHTLAPHVIHTYLIAVVFYKTTKSLVLADTPIHTVDSLWRYVLVDLRSWRSSPVGAADAEYLKSIEMKCRKNRTQPKLVIFVACTKVGYFCSLYKSYLHVVFMYV